MNFPTWEEIWKIITIGNIVYLCMASTYWFFNRLFEKQARYLEDRVKEAMMWNTKKD